MIKYILKKLSKGENLSLEEAKQTIDCFSKKEATPGQIGSFLTAITMKTPTTEEMTGFVFRMRELATRIEIDTENIVDSCGTGGDASGTFNISTTAAIIAASCNNIIVAKHANYGITSKCGSSNVVSELGINLVKTPKEAKVAATGKGITFIHSPFFHSATASVNPIRQELGFRTVFNFLGPLVNPSFPTGQVIGVADLKMAPKMIEVLKNVGCKKALVVHGINPIIDEISICGETKIFRLQNGLIDDFTVSPEDFGIKKATLEDLKGSTPKENAILIKEILKGSITGAKKDAVAINAAGMLWAGNQVATLEEGLSLAYNLIESGKAYKKLEELN